ncbi:MAG TPA: hypothetical protein VIS96_16570 [Terrimicrobiaceae bacterium]
MLVRNFLKTSVDSLPSTLNLGEGLSIELLGQEKMFFGLGAVSQSGVTLRSGQRPMFVEIRNPSAVELLNYRLLHCEISPEKVLLRFSVEAREGGLMEWMVHEVRPRYNTADWTRGSKPAEDTTLELELRGVRRTIGGRDYSGFSYLYRYQSASIPTYKILDRGSWEVGGSVLANEFWMRNCFVPPITRIESAEQLYSTEWYIPDCANPSAFQFIPLQTEFQGFTFTTSSAGLLITWASEVAHIRSLFEKPRGERVMAHFHEHCGDLGHEFSTSPVEVLWSPGARSRVDFANDYEAMRELVHQTLHEQAGLRRERVTTFGQIEEWTPADLDRYRTLGLPKLLGAGMKTIYLANHFENNMNTWGVSNFCVTVDHKVAESVGEDRLRAFCKEARAGGATVQMWANTAISTLNLLLDKRVGDSDRIRFLPREGSIMEALDRNTSFVRNASNAIEADHYTPEFAVLNLRDPAVREYWLRRWQAAHDEVGLGAIFLDSSFNLSSDKFHYVQNTQAQQFSATADQTHLLGFYRPAIEPPAAILSQYRAHLELMAEMQRIGYGYANEDLGVFGIHRHGPSTVARLDSLFMWADCLASFDIPAIRQSGHDPDDVYFRGLAYRMMWSLHWDVSRDALSFHYGGLSSEEDVPRAHHIALLRAYNEVEPAMRERAILPGEAGVLYRSPSRQVVWAFEDLSLPAGEGESIRDVLSGELVDSRPFLAKKNRVYMIESAD